MTPTKTLPKASSKTSPAHARLNRALEAVPDTPSTRDDDRRDWSRIALWGGLTALLLLVLGGGYVLWQGQSAEQEKDQLLSLIDTECGPGGSWANAPICVATAPQRADDTAAAATATGVDAAQVIELVRAELAANPPADGRTPTPDEVAGLVRSVLAENPQLYRGEPGRPGENAPPPTDAQVQAAVAAVMAANPDLYRGADGQSPPCLAEPTQCRGQDGKPPVQITQQYADGSTSVCTRDAGSPDSAPTYTCPAPTGGTPSPDPDTTSEQPPPATENPDPSTPTTEDTAPGGLFGG